jgi:hypothetical protein
LIRRGNKTQTVKNKDNLFGFSYDTPEL